MKTVSIYGYHGHRNLGDDLFLLLTCRWLSRNLGVTKAFVSSRAGVQPRQLEGVEIIPMFSQPPRVARMQWLIFLLYAMRSEAIFFSAGSVFRIQPFFLMYIVLSVIRIFKGRSFPIVAIGVSFGPFKNKYAEHWCKKVVKRFSHLLVRDEPSWLWLNQSSLPNFARLSFDLVTTLVPSRPSQQIEESRPEVLGISINRDILATSQRVSYDQLLCDISRELNAWVKLSPARVLRFFIICCDSSDGDDEITRDLVGRLSCGTTQIEVMPHSTDAVFETVRSISSCSAMVASRMHAGVVAAINEVPLFQISYAKKIDHFFARSGLKNVSIQQVDKNLANCLHEFLNSPKMPAHFSSVEFDRVSEMASADLMELANDLNVPRV